MKVKFNYLTFTFLFFFVGIVCSNAQTTPIEKVKVKLHELDAAKNHGPAQKINGVYVATLPVTVEEKFYLGIADLLATGSTPSSAIDVMYAKITRNGLNTKLYKLKADATQLLMN